MLVYFTIGICTYCRSISNIWYILWSFGVFCGYLGFFHLVPIFCGYLIDFVVIWYILWSFGVFCGYLVLFHLVPIFCGYIYFPVLVCCTMKYLATLPPISKLLQ
jgi:hypothetical protein